MYGSIAFTDSYEKSKRKWYRLHKLCTTGRSYGMKNKHSFQRRLEETEQSKHDSSFPRDYRQYKALKCGRYLVSIQGSRGHYCTPRETIGANEYFSMEIAIFPRYTRNKHVFLNVNRSKKLKAFPRISELMERADGPQPTVFGYVPVDLIQDLINYMEEKK